MELLQATLTLTLVQWLHLKLMLSWVAAAFRKNCEPVACTLPEDPGRSRTFRELYASRTRNLMRLNEQHPSGYLAVNCRKLCAMPSSLGGVWWTCHKFCCCRRPSTSCCRPLPLPPTLQISSLRALCCPTCWLPTSAACWLPPPSPPTDLWFCCRRWQTCSMP